MPYLLYFDVSNNNLTGEIPPFESVSSGYFDEGKNFHYPFIGVYNNSFSGVIPQDLCPLEPDFLGFDCSDTLCGCSCECANVTNSNSEPPPATSSLNTPTEEGTNATDATDLNV